MKVTTKEEHFVILRLVVDLESKTIRATSAEIVNGFCPLCKTERTNVVNLMTCKTKWKF